MYKTTEYQNKADTYYQHTRAEMFEFIPENSKKILEIGCGNGAFAKLVKSKIVCEYWGVEPDERFKDIATSNLDFFIPSMFDENIKLPNKEFDVIVFNDVLEHLLYPETILILCKKFLKENGVIISSIPNIRYAPYLYRLVYRGEFEYEDAGIMDRTHFRFFTEKSIENMYQRCGYLVLKNVGINSALPRKFCLLTWIANTITNGKFKDISFQQIATIAQLK